MSPGGRPVGTLAGPLQVEQAANVVQHLTLHPEAWVPALDFSILVPEARHRKAAILRPNVVKEVLAEGTFA